MTNLRVSPLFDTNPVFPLFDVVRYMISADPRLPIVLDVPGDEDDVGLARGDDLLHQLWIAKSAYRADRLLDRLFDLRGIYDIDRVR